MRPTVVLRVLFAFVQRIGLCARCKDSIMHCGEDPRTQPAHAPRWLPLRRVQLPPPSRDGFNTWSLTRGVIYAQKNRDGQVTVVKHCRTWPPFSPHHWRPQVCSAAQKSLFSGHECSGYATTALKEILTLLLGTLPEVVNAETCPYTSRSWGLCLHPTNVGRGCR